MSRRGGSLDVGRRLLVLRVVVVGDRDSGKTTFLGLLYTAQVKSGSDRADDFRFHATFDSLDEITGVFQGLMSGSFPDSATKEGIHEVTFRLGYRKPGLGILSRLRPRGWDDGAFASFRLILVRAFEDESSRSRAGSSRANTALRDVFESDAMVIMVDARKLAVADEDPQLAPMGKYDASLESLLTAIQRSRERGDRKQLHPIFVFSKFDRAEPEALHLAKLEGSPPGVGKTGPRAAYAQALLDRNLPKTMAKVLARERQGLKFARPSYFFSWVRTNPPGPGRVERVRLRRSGAVGWEPDYSRDECLAFLECLWDIAAHTAD